MTQNKCNTCFYAAFDDDDQPCVQCRDNNLYVNYMLFKPDTVAIKTWDGEDAFDKKEDVVSDNVNSPKHYTKGKYEVIDVIEDWDLNFRLANAVKYIARHKHKGKPLEDLKKALWYLEREIDKWNTLSKS